LGQAHVCRVCGSTLQFVHDGAATFGLALSALDTPVAVADLQELHRDTCVDW
jgi:hypothetical protein